MEWISVKDKIPKESDIFTCKRESGDTLKCYFHKDQMVWMTNYCKSHRLSYWQCKASKEWLYDVTHWMSLPEPPKDT